MDDLDRIPVGVPDPRDQKTVEPLVWGCQGGSSACGEFGEGGSSVIGPKDHSRPLALGYWIEAVVVASRGDRGNADLVAVEYEIDVDGISLDRYAEGLGEP